MTKIARDLLTLEPSALIELVVLDATAIGGSIYRFVNQSNPLAQAVVWQGQTYTPFPLELSGFEVGGDGPAPRPRLQIANVFGFMGTLIRSYDQLQGCKVIRKRTQAQYLDAVNFSGGNANADTAAAWPDEVYQIDRVVSRDNLRAEFELCSPLDLPGVMLPRRQINAKACCWAYRSAECGYTGGAVAKEDDTATSNMALDRCGRRLASCKLRFGATAELPFGGFPGAGLVRQA
jgi:lambda family phage minor tail protein L